MAVAVLALLLALAEVASLSSASQSPRAADCMEWHECRQLALSAAERGEYETFHDLAWRAVQTGPPKDPALMYLLARAQTLSGRPHDALDHAAAPCRVGGGIPRGSHQRRVQPHPPASGLAGSRGSNPGAYQSRRTNRCDPVVLCSAIRCQGARCRATRGNAARRGRRDAFGCLIATDERASGFAATVQTSRLDRRLGSTRRRLPSTLRRRRRGSASRPGSFQ